MKATQSLIGTVWTLEYRILEDKRLEILSYSREDDEGYEREKHLPRLRMVEGEGRVVEKVILEPYEPLKYCANAGNPEAKIYEVSNPRYVFSYPFIKKETLIATQEPKAVATQEDDVPDYFKEVLLKDLPNGVKFKVKEAVRGVIKTLEYTKVKNCGDDYQVEVSSFEDYKGQKVRCESWLHIDTIVARPVEIYHCPKWEYNLYVNGQHQATMTNYDWIYQRAIALLTYLKIPNCFVNTGNFNVPDKWKTDDFMMLISKDRIEYPSLNKGYYANNYMPY